MEKENSPEAGAQEEKAQVPADNEDGQAPLIEDNSQGSGENEPDAAAQNKEKPSRENGRPGNGFGIISFDKHVEDGTISQETCDAIKKYEENKPQAPEKEISDENKKTAGEKEGERPQLPENRQEQKTADTTETETTEEYIGA